MTPPFRSRELARMTRLVRGGGLLLVYGPDAQEAAELVGAALPRRTQAHTGIVDVDRCESTEELARRVLRASADALAGDDRLLDIPEDRRTAAQHKRWLEVRRVLGKAFELLEGSTPGAAMDRKPTRIVSHAMAALARGSASSPRRHALVMRGVDSLVEVPRSRFKDPARLLWSMRSAAQGAKEVLLVLTGGPASIELVSAHDAAFRGWGRTFQLKRFDAAELGAAISSDRGVDVAVGRRIAELSEGLPGLADRLAERAVSELTASPQVDPVEAAWRGLLHDERSRCRLMARLIADLHRAALPVCRALASGGAPYGAARSTEVTRALRLVYARGLCESPAPRTWRLTDPLLAAWLNGDDTTTGDW
jgi:hypothetical protein